MVMSSEVKAFIVEQWNNGASSDKIRTLLIKKYNLHYEHTSIRGFIARERKKGNAAKAQNRS